MKSKVTAWTGLVVAVISVALSPDYANLIPENIHTYLSLIGSLLAAVGGSIAHKQK